jgi:chromate transport protein ChrA
MRWKLLIITSLVTAFVGAGVSVALSYFFNFRVGSLPRNFSSDWLLIVALLVPLTAIVFASTFVYRHTPRRRYLQTMLTILFAAVLTLVAIALASYFLRTVRSVSTRIAFTLCDPYL